MFQREQAQGRGMCLRAVSGNAADHSYRRLPMS